jgi:hypothetical protein
LNRFFGTTPTPELMLKAIIEHPILTTQKLITRVEAATVSLDIKCVAEAIRQNLAVLRTVNLPSVRRTT